MKRILCLFFSVLILSTYVFAVEEVVEEPVVEEPVVEEPVVEEPVVEEPVVEEPVVEEPLVEEPVVEDPVVEEPVVDDPISSFGGGDIINEITEIYLMGDDIPADAVITDISVMSLAPITPSDTSGLKAVLLEVIGDYDPVIIEYAYENYNGSTAYLREVQPDYVWQGSLLLFGLIIYCLFRLGGALIRD